MDISYNNLGNNGAILLSKGLAGEINLRKLAIVDCKITLQGGEGFFLNLGSNASIQELYIDNNKIGKAIDAQVKATEMRKLITDVYNKILMGSCTEKTNSKYGITREEQDIYCIKSYQRSAEAWSRNFFLNEVQDIEVSTKKGSVIVKEDEEFKKVKFDKVPGLKPVFEKNVRVLGC